MAVSCLPASRITAQAEAAGAMSRTTPESLMLRAVLVAALAVLAAIAWLVALLVYELVS